MVDEAAHLQEDEKITLFSIGTGDVFVWDADDVFTLRTKYRIVGSLIGSLPRKPRQNVCLSLPLLLSKYEITLLLDKNYARLVESPKDPSTPSQEEVDMFEKLRKESIREQIELFDLENEEKEKEIHSILEDERKPRKRKGRKRRMVDNDDAVKPEKLLKSEESEEMIDKADKTEGSSEKMDLAKNTEKSSKDIKPLHNVSQEQSDKNSLKTECRSNCITEDSVSLDQSVLILGDSKMMSYLQQDQHETKPSLQQNIVEPESSSETGGPSYLHETNLSSHDSEMTSTTQQEHSSKILQQQQQEESQREKGCVIQIPTKMPLCKTKSFPILQWNNPESQIEQVKFKVFKDLWERGYYITTGSKYGGDFLVYLGDPFKFHSSYVVMVMLPSKKFGMLDLISIGRLAATVKKTAVLATVDGSINVIYSSIKWSGIS